MSNENSCVSCKFLYSHDSGYSNYTVLDTEIICALDLNKNLPKDEPYDWNKEKDNWPATKNSRCSSYALGPMVCLDVDGDDSPSDFTEDEEVISIICKHSGRGE